MENTVTKEVVDVLTATPDTIEFESMPSEENSPLNQSVKERDILEDKSTKDWNVWKPELKETGIHDTSGQTVTSHTTAYDEPISSNTEDAPEQDFDNKNMESDVTDQQQKTANTETETNQEVFELPTATAKQAADTILGISNNVLAIGGGFFIKIRKHKDFYEFEEVVELIDTQNKKNIKRIQLDKDDKALLKPLLVAILKKKAKKLTPEQQLMGAALSILVKKAQVVMEIKAENEILIDRILHIVREERGISDIEETSKTTPKTEHPIDIPDVDFEQITKDITAIENEIDPEEPPTENYDDMEELYTNVVEVLDENANSKLQ